MITNYLNLASINLKGTIIILLNYILILVYFFYLIENIWWYYQEKIIFNICYLSKNSVLFSNKIILLGDFK